jgi:hypothetical protein
MDNKKYYYLKLKEPYLDIKLFLLRKDSQLMKLLRMQYKQRE